MKHKKAEEQTELPSAGWVKRLELPVAPLILVVGAIAGVALGVADVVMVLVVAVAPVIGIADAVVVGVVVNVVLAVPDELVVRVVAVAAGVSVGDELAVLVVMVSHVCHLLQVMLYRALMCPAAAARIARQLQDITCGLLYRCVLARAYTPFNTAAA